MNACGSPKIFCFHCEKYVPYRTYTNHKQRYFDVTNGEWQRDISLQESSDEDVLNSQNESASMPSVGSSDEREMPDEPFDINVNEIDNGDEYLELANGEIWDDELSPDIDVDFVGSLFADSVPDSDAQSNDETNTQSVILQWILMGLFHLWSVFRIPDTAVAFLITFLKRLFQVISWSNTWFEEIATDFPSSLYSLKKELNLLSDNFSKYVVCPKCHSIYKFEDCVNSVGGRNVSKRCSFIKHPNHRQRWRRQQCGAFLLKEVTLKDGSKRLYPHKVYCYQSVIKTLQTFVSRRGFTDRCEVWRNREVRTFAQVLCDVFEGRIWRDFQCFNGTPFLAEPRNYAFMLNVDWIQPFVHTTYSVGVMYLVLMNLPRSERFKRENVILVGVIPGPCKAPLTINTYLLPLVDELLKLWDTGVSVKQSWSPCSP